MELVVISAEHVLPGEAVALNRLFELGMPGLHLRKPGAPESSIREIVEGLDDIYRDRVVLHDHFGLAGEYGLKGVHLNSRNPVSPSAGLGHVSRSCHTLEEVAAAAGKYNYVFLSPIFDSISKEGYCKAFTENELYQAGETGIINGNVFALGGVDENTMLQAARLGFGGVAILGSLWGDYLKFSDAKALEKRFERLFSKAREL